MIISGIYAGLGNQMFQYATGFALAKTRKEKFLIDTSQTVFDERPYALSEYNISAETLKIKTHKDDNRFQRMISGFKRLLALGLRGITVTEKEQDALSYKEQIFPVGCSLYLKGYWQNYRYFHLYRKELRKEFSYKNQLSSTAELFGQAAAGKNVIGIHIRRGDYINYSGWTVHSSYYLKALDAVRKKLSEKGIEETLIFVFCEDREFAENLLAGQAFTLITDRSKLNDLEEFEVMRKCRNLIISNSSYSWWAAYLNEYQDNIIAAPVWKKWSREFYLPEWIGIEMNGITNDYE